MRSRTPAAAHTGSFMNHAALYADPYYPSFLGALRGALHAWTEGRDSASIEAWTASCCLETAMDLLTVGLPDEAVETARRAWEATVIGSVDERDAVLEKLKCIEAEMPQPAENTADDAQFRGWRTEFLVGVRTASTAINDSTSEHRSGPVYVPDEHLDSWVAAVVYLSAWAAPGHQVGAEYAHWAAFYGGGQPPPRTGGAGRERGVSRFCWGRWGGDS